ncbi:ABC transporter ATP-binding protein [Deinococcus peraridilitoris]|uniref:ABC-type branched-chain amino acid transport systems, ATPase component n=1 Tax=Deinococcus peraridilitoris (strain DSM 19664 / LMG 22246 / CIP 109416 / KR-200) TaxID=937777 RepID=L0A0U2_DEIPD|nr:ABC transporter ATP-binding protein [Deinococcus peraridilitoris]AFZ67513.1 ABC-type branched-chain amino acid transport systems, ATPase component [Deinococcus peraridilitoris DSM 19664]
MSAPTASTVPLLRAQNLAKRFGGLMAVADISFDLYGGEILAVIGPNGAGKTTLLNLLSGLYRPTTGQLQLMGRDVTNLSMEERCHLGLGRAFQIVRPFPEMTVLENVTVGALFGKSGTSLGTARAQAWELLEFTGLSAHADKPAHELTLLQDKRLEVARALATQPKVLLLDEVMAGLRPGESQEAVELVRRVQAGGVSVLFIEHIMPVVRDLAHRVVVMDAGRVLAQGTYAQVVREPRVIEAYLGSEMSSEVGVEAEVASGAGH